MEILPDTVANDAYVSALTRTKKATFADTLSRAVNTPSGAEPVTAEERYIATLDQDSRRTLDAAMQQYVKMNRPEIKEGIDAALKAGYPGTDYQKELGKKLDITQPQNRSMRDAWNMLQVANMQLALVTAQNKGTQATGDKLPVDDSRRIGALLAGFPANASSGYDFLAPLKVDRFPVPGMTMISLRDGLTLANGDRARPRQYVYSPEAIHGDQLFEANDFKALLKRSQVARDVVASRVALADMDGLQNAFENMQRQGPSVALPVGYALVDNYDPYREMVEGRIADADEKTVSRAEVIRDAAMTGVGAMALPACVVPGPVAAATCATLTAASLADDGYEAVKLWSRDEHGMALSKVLLSTLDVADVGKGISAVGRAAGIGRGLGALGTPVPAVLKGVSGGAQGTLDRLGLKTFGSVADASGSAADVERHSGAFESGWLKRDWAANVDLGNARRTTPPGAPAGDLYELNGKTYIRERGYAGEAPMAYEVRVDNGGAVRVINPHHRGVPADKVRWNGIQWVKDSQGLRGGVGPSDTQLLKELHGMRKALEMGVSADIACDTKAQHALKIIQKDKNLWEAVKDKIDVRVIKIKDDSPDSELTLHPRDELEARWTGKYHVYLTVKANDERMIIDPYVGGPDSCATVREQAFLKHHWRGSEGQDYEVRNLAPANETYPGGDPNNPDDQFEYSIEEFMNSDTVFDPETYPSHQFYYDNN